MEAVYNLSRQHANPGLFPTQLSPVQQRYGNQQTRVHEVSEVDAMQFWKEQRLVIAQRFFKDCRLELKGGARYIALPGTATTGYGHFEKTSVSWRSQPGASSICGAARCPIFRRPSTSAVTNTTGYGDVLLPEACRLDGGVEALAGILMCGWSTGFFFAIVNRLHEPDSRQTISDSPISLKPSVNPISQSRAGPLGRTPRRRHAANHPRLVRDASRDDPPEA